MLWHTNDVTGTPDDRKGKEVEGSRSKLDRVLVGNGTYMLSKGLGFGDAWSAARYAQRPPATAKRSGSSLILTF